jgi:hypothetical protein
LRYATDETRSQRLIEAGIAAPLRDALLSGNSGLLETLLGQPANICCLIYAPQDDAPERDEPDQDQGEK